MSHLEDKESLASDTNDNTKYKDGVNRNARLIVRNLSFKANEDSLKELFSAYGNVEEVKLLRKANGKLVGCGFVHFTHVPMANKALTETNKKIFLGRPLHVAWAVPKHKYQENSQEMFFEDRHGGNGEIKTVPAKMKPKPKVEEEKPKVRIKRNARLIVRNISFKATEESLREHFEPYGILHEVKLLKKSDGKLVGCAFVHYKNVPMAKKALLNTNMKPYLGRPISVDWAVSKNKYMQYIDQQQLELQENIKKEDCDSNSDNETPAVNVNNEVKPEVKDESDEAVKSEEEDSTSDDEDSDNDEKIPNNVSETSALAEKKRLKLNDAEDGCTVFMRNIPFSIDDDQLKEFIEKTGPVKYALICVDKLTEHSRGTGFAKFVNKEDADRFLSLSVDSLKLDGQVIQVKPALKKENLENNKKKEPKDNRNLYLVKEGVVVAGTKAAVGVSASDMAKRLTLERNKTQMLKNLNRFVSKYRLVVSNLPLHYDDAKLRRICLDTVGQRAIITEARVMRHLREQIQPNGKYPSKGYGFVMFMKHEDALTCLRKLNNNPDIFDRNNRPIVSFSIEDRTALNARKKRLEKSIANNPLHKNVEKRKREKFQKPDESKIKMRKFEKISHEAGKFVKIQNVEEFSGLTAKEGAQHKLRSNQKLKSQAEVHKKNVKLEKKKSKKALKLKMAAKERIKLPKMKVNKNPKKPRETTKDTKNFTELVTKYKTKLTGNNLAIKSKWYET